jgi:hypothetical protein
LLSLTVRARLAGVLGQRDAIALVLQDLRQEFANPDFIVDDQDLARLRRPWIHQRCTPIALMRGDLCT